MSKKTITIICVVLSVLLFVFVLLPRLFIFGTARKFMPDIEKEALQFSEYPVSAFDGKTALINNGVYTVMIPYGFEANETNGNKTYKYESSGMMVALIKPTPFEMDMIGSFSDDSAKKKLTDFFASLGNGVPDSGFGTEKYIALLKPSDYSFWNLKKGFAFAITGILKNAVFGSADSIYIYESGNVRGIITVTKRADENNYRIQCEMFSTSDLNTVNTLLIAADSPEKAYPIISSVSFS